MQQLIRAQAGLRGKTRHRRRGAEQIEFAVAQWLEGLAKTYRRRATACGTQSTFDSVRWSTDPLYRADYLSRAVPGRVWQTADGAAGVPHRPARQE